MTEVSYTDYTKGNIWGHFIKLMIPLIVGNILQQLYNTIDTLIIGKFAGAEEFAAVGLSSSVMNLLLFAVIGFCTGVSILFAQSYGAGDWIMFRNCHFLSVLLIGPVILFSLLWIMLLPNILGLMQTPEELLSYAESYLRVIIGGLFISYLYNMYAGLLRSIGKASIALLALGIAVLINTVLDLFFIGKLQMGIQGAAIATVCAQGISLLFCMIYVWGKEGTLCFSLKTVEIQWTLLWRILRIGLVTCIHQVSLYLGKLLIQGTVNREGTEMIAAYTATGRIEGFANSFGDSGSAVTSILVAQNAGAGKKDRIQKTFRVSLSMMIILGIVSSCLMYLFSDMAVVFLLGDYSIAAYQAIEYLKIISLFYIFCFTGNTFAGFYDGLGKVKIPFIGALSHMTLRVICSYFWIPMMGLVGLSYATGLGWVLVNAAWAMVLLVVWK